MIYTAENIVDPVEFIKSDPGIIEDLGAHESQVISGVDIDMLVTPLDEGEEPKRVGRLEGRTNDILGSLYVQGFVKGAFVGSRQFDIDWYPSPNYVNALIERLDLRPGEDIMRFVHSQGYGEIPCNRYMAHLGRGEYPQSTTKINFDHDRNDDHAPGVLLAPPMVTSKVIEYGTNTNTDTKRGTSRAKVLTDVFDTTTSRINRTTNRLAPFIGQEWSAVAESIDHDWTFLRYILPHNDFFGIEAKDWNSNKKLPVLIARTIFEHLVEITPKIERLKTETPVPDFLANRFSVVSR